VEGAVAPDALAVAVDLGVVARGDVVAVPESVGQLSEPSGQQAFQGFLVPTAVCDEVLQGFPVVGLVDAEQCLGEGVVLQGEDQSGSLLDEAAVSGDGEGGAEAQEQG